VLLVSELDNWIALAFPGAKDDAPSDASPGGLATLEWVLFDVLLRPVLEEFFFRGVVQQGAVAVLGPARGVLHTAVLFALVRIGVFGADAYHTATLAAQALAIGVLLGYVRLASGSILACVLLQAALEASGVAAMFLRDAVPIPGFNAAGAHTPLTWLAPAAAAVVLGVAGLARSARAPATT
jgi:membrane protease YdiL (CAAX protease family)